MPKYTFIVEKTAEGFRAYAQNYAVSIMGQTFKELKTNATEALSSQLDDRRRVTEEDVILSTDLKQFAAFYTSPKGSRG